MGPAEAATQLALGHLSETPGSYRRRSPEETLLYQVIQKNWLTFREQAESAGKTPPFYIIREFEDFLKCGILAHGFLRLKCESCKHEKLVAFSCKKRGFCSSCCARRMIESSVFLSTEVFPAVPVRQWVMSFPIPLRYWMALNPKLMTTVLGIVSRAIRTFYRNRAPNSETGAVTLIQRFGGSVNLNLHFHQLWVEGGFVRNFRDPSGRAVYRYATQPSDQDVADALKTIRHRVVRALIKRGYLESEDRLSESAQDNLELNEPLLAEVMAASTQSKIALGERAGLRVRRVGSFGLSAEKPELTGAKCASLGGFSLHANVFIPGGEPAKLERLLRYMARPPVAESRLFKTEDGDIGYSLKTFWNDGTSAVRFSPLEFIEKLVALIPPPRIHLVRFHGVFAPHHSWRKQVVPEHGAAAASGSLEKDAKPNASPEIRMRWADLLKHVFQIDLTKCPDCGGTLKFIAVVMKRSAIESILNHLKFKSEPELFAPPRGPPETALLLN